MRRIQIDSNLSKLVYVNLLEWFAVTLTIRCGNMSSVLRNMEKENRTFCTGLTSWAFTYSGIGISLLLVRLIRMCICRILKRSHHSQNVINLAAKLKTVNTKRLSTFNQITNLSTPEDLREPYALYGESGRYDATNDVGRSLCRCSEYVKRDTRPMTPHIRFIMMGSWQRYLVLPHLRQKNTE